MTSVTLSCIEDENRDIGLVIPGLRNDMQINAASSGELIAHDLLEHQNGAAAIGTFEDEIMAYGALWYIRAQFGEFRPGGMQYIPVDQSIAISIAHMSEDYLYSDYDPVKVPRMSCTPFESTFEWITDEAYQIARRSQIEQRGECLSNQQCRDNLRAIKQFTDNALRFMSWGAAKADRRFGGVYEAHNMFWGIAKAVDPYAKNCEYEGQKFRLNYTKESAECYEIIETDFGKWERSPYE